MNFLTRFWRRTTLATRLVAAITLILFFGTLIIITVLVDAYSQDAKKTIRLDADEIARFISPLVAEQAVIGDYETIRQLLVTVVHRRPGVRRIIWTSSESRTLHASYTRSGEHAPAWFIQMLDLKDQVYVREIRLGGVSYGRLKLIMHHEQTGLRIWRNAQYISWVFAAMIVMSLVAILFLVRLSTRPLLSLANVANHIGHGNFEERIVEHGSHEVAISTDAFNEMADRLATAHDKLSENREVLRDQLRFTEELIQVLPVPVFVKDCDGLFIGINRAWTRLFRLSTDDILGKDINVLFPGNKDLVALHKEYDQRVCGQNGVHE